MLMFCFVLSNPKCYLEALLDLNSTGKILSHQEKSLAKLPFKEQQILDESCCLVTCIDVDNITKPPYIYQHQIQSSGRYHHRLCIHTYIPPELGEGKSSSQIWPIQYILSTDRPEGERENLRTSCPIFCVTRRWSNLNNSITVLYTAVTRKIKWKQVDADFHSTV